jgi:hypothetical protein
MLSAAAATLGTAPIVAQAASSRSAAALQADNGIGESDSNLTRVLVLLLIAGAIFGGIELFGDDEPASP